MALSEDLINFDLIETHKENIQSLPGGRSARQLASILSPLPSGRALASPSLDETKTFNDAIRKEYEIELQSIADSDDPLDIYDRYVKWTLDAYPSAQATTQSQLLPLLERATKAFLTSSHYKNDPRYLKLWLHYIRLFSDTPRETFAFLARHHIGEGLGLFYEEFAAWLEGAGRWNQAEEVYKLGMEREARPAERLMRKHNQFKQRYDSRPQNPEEPSSPALPTVRPALAAKVDPFASTPRDDPQAAASRNQPSAPAPPRSGKPKMAIFSDSDAAGPVAASSTTKGWDSIGSMKERKKENTMEAKPWAGETLKAGKKVGMVPKMEIFKDPTFQVQQSEKVQSSNSVPVVVNPRTGRAERVFVNVEAIYPNEHEEFSFEELRAMSRGWANRDWRRQPTSPMRTIPGNAQRTPQHQKATETVDVENLSQSFNSKIDIHDTSTQSMVGMPEVKQPKQKRMKVREVKQEVQTVKTRLESPTGRKLKRKGSAEPTMTFHSKAVTNEIYDMFNQPLRSQSKDDTQSGDDTDYGDDTYSTAGESTGTGRISAATSEFGDDTLNSVRTDRDDNVENQTESVSPWSDFTASKHIPNPTHKGKNKHKHRQIPSDDLTENLESSQNHTQNSFVDAGFDTQAIAALANQDFGEMDTKMIAQLAGDIDDEDEQEEEQIKVYEEVDTPSEEPETAHVEIQNKPRYVPLPPEDYEPTPIRPFRDPNEFAQHKLPFMTPIVERTESSLAPSTVYNENDFYEVKTPSRSAVAKPSQYDSPSKLKVDVLLLDSPQSIKRKSKATEQDLATSSPPKKQAIEDGAAQIAEDDFVIVAKPVEVAVPAQIEIDISKPKAPSPKSFSQPHARSIHKGPAITDLQCNPCDPAIREQILKVIHPPLASSHGYQDSSVDEYNHYNILKSFAKKMAKQKGSAEASPRKGQSEKTVTKAVPPILKFNGTNRVYAVKRELGQGAFAPVYLVDSYDPATAQDPDVDQENLLSATTTLSRQPLEALKTECPPHTLVWEFHILRLIRQRLGPASPTMKSIITAHECHLYRDESYLILSYSPQGTLLDLVNLSRADSIRQGKQPEGLDEVLAVYLSLELLRTMSSLHLIGILHGDLKADNCLVRFDTSTELTSSFSSHNSISSSAWSSKGLTLIDFGRGIDVRQFQPTAKFVADWPASAQDCAEIKDMRPWKWQIDFHGAAGVLHSLLFGKYIETIPVSTSSSTAATSPSRPLSSSQSNGLGHKKTLKLKESLKRYWDRELWSDVFDVLLNKASGFSDEDNKTREAELKRITRLMAEWLETEGERRDLRGAIRRAERLIEENTKRKGR